MSSRLPEDLHSYKRTPSFTEATVPSGLLSEHATKDGVWGLIHVEYGKLRYVVADRRRKPSEALLTSLSEPGIVEPTIVHRVEPVGAVRFHVEFLRSPAGT